jgi:3-oxoacyl-[acyl-carrier-protein] synthase II
MRTRVVTGLGVVSPLGTGREPFLGAIRSGKVPAYAGAAEVPDFDAAEHLGDKGLRSLDRLTKLLIVAARLALHDAGLKTGGAWSGGTGESVGMVVSNAYGSLEAITELDRVALLEDARYINPARFPLTVHNSAAGYASIWEDVRAINVSVSDGNCGALDAVACADVFLGHDRARALLVGGAEAMSEALQLAFTKLGAMQEGAVLGEGAALLVLETPELAAARGARVEAEVFGYGTAFEPPPREGVLLHPSTEAMMRAIHEALQDAAVKAEEVDFVVSGASGVRAFDEAETLAIRRVLGDGKDVKTPKRALGESLGAGGAMCMAAALAHFQEGGGGAAPRVALVTSLGFYGNASAVVMRGVKP